MNRGIIVNTVRANQGDWYCVTNIKELDGVEIQFMDSRTEIVDHSKIEYDVITYEHLFEALKEQEKNVCPL